MFMKYEFYKVESPEYGVHYHLDIGNVSDEEYDKLKPVIEHLGGQVDAEILNDIKIDNYGRRYQPTWLAVAKYNTETGEWSYYGDKSTENKYIGWDYQIDWYDADGVIINSDNVRINLSNKDCHFASEPYYMAGYAESSEVEDLKATIKEMENMYSWGEM